MTSVKKLEKNDVWWFIMNSLSYNRKNQWKRFSSFLIFHGMNQFCIMKTSSIKRMEWLCPSKFIYKKSRNMSLINFYFIFVRVERSSDQVIKPVNLEALTKWVGNIPEDVVHDMANIAPMLSVLGKFHASLLTFSKLICIIFSKATILILILLTTVTQMTSWKKTLIRWDGEMILTRLVNNLSILFFILKNHQNRWKTIKSYGITKWNSC